MKLAWSILFLVICNAEQVIGTWRRNSVDHPTTAITPVNGKHLRLLASPVSHFIVVQNDDILWNLFDISIGTRSSREFSIWKETRLVMSSSLPFRTRLAFTSLQLHVKHSIFLINHEFRLRRIRLLIFSLVIHTSPLLGLIYSSMTCPTNVEEWASYLKGLTLVYSLHFIQNKTIDCWLIASTWILGGWLVRRCCCRNSKQIQRFRFFSSVDGWSIKYPYSNPRIFC